MKREHSSRDVIIPQNSYESDQESVSALELQIQEGCKKASEQIKSVKPCSETKSTRKKVSHHHQQSSNTMMPNEAEESRDDTAGRERLKRHRVEVAGRVWIPEIWGQEELLKDWTDCCAVDAAIMNSSIMLARAALVEEGRRAQSIRLRIENSC